MLHSPEGLARPVRRTGISGDCFFASLGPLPAVCRAGAACCAAQQTWYIWRALLATVLFVFLVFFRGLPGRRASLHSSAALAYLAHQPFVSGESFSASFGLLPAVVCRAGAACSKAQRTWHIRRVGPAFLAALSQFPLSGCQSWSADPAPLAAQFSSGGTSRTSPAFLATVQFLCFLWFAACSGLLGRRRFLHSSGDLAYPSRLPSFRGGAFSVSFSWLLVMVCQAGAARSAAHLSWHIWRASPAFLATVHLLLLACCPQWLAGPAPLAPQLSRFGVSGVSAQPFWRRFCCFLF